MAKNEVNVLIKAKDLASSVVGRFRRTLRGITRTVKDVTRGVAALTAGTAALVLGLTKVAERGSSVIAVKRAFARITDDETAALERLREASANTIEDFKLMALHNQALSLGAARTTEEFAAMVDVSRRLGRAQGIEATDALEKFTVGMARQSKLRLDDLGIQIDTLAANERYAASLGKTSASLTEAEKKTAFMNETMREATRLVDELAASGLEGAESSNRFATSMANLRDRFAEVTAESPVVAAMFEHMEEVVTNIVDIIGGDADLMIEGMKTLGRLAGDAFSIGVNEALEAFVDKGNFFGRFVARQFGGNADVARENLAANEVALGAIAAAARAQAEARRRQRGGGGGGAGGGGGVGSVGGAGVSSGLFDGFIGTEANLRELFSRLTETESALKGAQLDAALAPTEEAAEKARAKVVELQEALEGLQTLAARFGGVSGLIEGGFLGGVDLRLQHGTPRQVLTNAPGAIDLDPEELAAATEGLGLASEVVIDSFANMADAAVTGSHQMERAVISSLQNIIANIQTSSGGLFGGTLLGGIAGVGLGILGGIFGGGGDKRPIPVKVDNYSAEAERKMREASTGPDKVTVIVKQNGQTIEQIDYDLRRRENRDAISRFPAGLPIKGGV